MPAENTENTLDQLLDEFKKAEEQATRCEKEIVSAKEILDGLNAKSASLLDSIRNLRNRTPLKAQEGKVAGASKAKGKRDTGLTDAILEQCREPKTKSELVENIGNKFNVNSMGAALSKLKKGGRLVQQEDKKYRTVEAKTEE